MKGGKKKKFAVRKYQFRRETDAARQTVAKKRTLKRKAKDAKEMLGNPLAGTVGEEVAFKELPVSREEFFALGVVLIKTTGVIEMRLNPILEVLEVAKIDHEAVGVCFRTGKG